MQKKRRCYTLIIAPTSGARFFKIILRHWHIYALGLGLLVCLFLAGGLFIDYHQIRREHEALQERHLELVNNLESRLASVEAQSHQVRQMAEGLGLILEQAMVMETGPTTSGVGGPSELDSLTKELDRVASTLNVWEKHLGAEQVRLATTPIGWPTPGRVTSGFGRRRNPFGGGAELHTGVDIGANIGQPVHATADGLVIYAGPRGGYGNLVVLDHGRDVRTFYAHLSAISVTVGTRVLRGDSIGLAGQTGRATAAHVHYEIRINDQPVDPQRYVSAR